MQPLYHYSCRHTVAQIERDAMLRPSAAWRHYDTLMICNGEPMSGLWRAPAVLWLTDLERPRRRALGLTSQTLDCDRTEYRYTVERSDTMVPWLDFATQHGANPEWLAVLHDGREPEHWYVAVQPVPFVAREEVRSLPRHPALSRSA